MSADKVLGYMHTGGIASENQNNLQLFYQNKIRFGYSPIVYSKVSTVISPYRIKAIVHQPKCKKFGHRGWKGLLSHTSCQYLGNIKTCIRLHTPIKITFFLLAGLNRHANFNIRHTIASIFFRLKEQLQMILDTGSGAFFFFLF